MPINLTKEGFEKLKKELKHLKTVKRREIIKAIAEARSKGDLSENAEYDAAKDEQAHIERRISELETMLSDVRIIDGQDIDKDKAYLGAAVHLKDMVRNENLVYKLVSKEEADFKENKISVDSPVGKTLLGKKVGDVVEINIPAGKLKYKILKIER